jgi:hypothetical protein
VEVAPELAHVVVALEALVGADREELVGRDVVVRKNW